MAAAATDHDDRADGRVIHGSGNPLPTTTYTYNICGDVLTSSTTAGSTTRTTTGVYDAADGSRRSRWRSRRRAVRALPAATYTYDTATGLPTAATTGSGGTAQSITMSYDTLG